jgi:hypothetical protein
MKNSTFHQNSAKVISDSFAQFVTSFKRQQTPKRIWPGAFAKFIKMRGKKGGAGVDPNPVNLIDIISTGYKAAVMAMLEQIRVAKNDQWQHTSKQAALYWLRVMKETIVSNLI